MKLRTGCAPSPGSMWVEEHLILACEVKSGSWILTLMAPTIDCRTSAGSKAFLKWSRTVFTTASRNAAWWVPPWVVCWPLTKE